ncbi:MAG: adenosylcobinamide-GDP ribazoletransferase [Defluviitaleaceae bacterium]|nr:adenosylcobinamide-GDP ribazoletransferase [Defluviitaleaceae bacterium]
MRYLKGFYMALGMFIGIPLPYHFWDEKYTAIMVASIPFVGAILGTLWWLAGVLLITANIPVMLAAAVLAMVPFFIAGFIHLDGYMDTSDAVLSWRPLEDKLRILKDPHVGSFAVVMLGILFVFQFAAMYTIAETGQYLALIIAIAVISRCCSAMSIFFLRHMPESNYTSMLSQNVKISHRIFVVAVTILGIGAAFFYAGVFGLIVAGAVILGYGVAIRFVSKNLKGISGDLLGYAMVISEVCGLVALAALQGR